MPATVPYERKCDWWNGRVVIDELKIYGDDRGMVAETFRTDDDSITSKMCYISETKPFVLRGPHEHETQKDSFVTWKTRMIYQMYNKETKEMKWFVTDPTKITRVIVDIGIVHSYRNISLEDAKTLNFPDQLFMGEDKKGFSADKKIDEIRHEETIKPSKNIWVLGAGGRLGSAITKSLFDDMGYHTYHVIPVYDKVDNNKEGMKNLSDILEAILEYKTENDVVINCIAKTNVQGIDDDYIFPNFLLPKYLAEFASKNEISFVHFSTDYVYQEGLVSEYTKSKKSWENWFNIKLEEEQYIGDEVRETIKVVRVANLFSQNLADTHNVLNKLDVKFKIGTVSSPEGLRIMPTDVALLADWLSKKYIHNLDKYRQIVNVSGKPYTFEEIYAMTGLTTPLKIEVIEEPDIVNNPDVFLNNPNFIELDCDLAIRAKLATIIP